MSDHRSQESAAATIVVILGLLLLGMVILGGYWFLRTRQVNQLQMAQMQAMAAEQQARAEAMAARAAAEEAQLESRRAQEQKRAAAALLPEPDAPDPPPMAAVADDSTARLELRADVEEPGRSELYLNGEPIALDELVERLKELDPQATEIAADQDVLHERVIEVIDACLAAGISDLLLKMRDSGETATDPSEPASSGEAPAATSGAASVE
jgi:uncharacterized iron-regulated membrane protein